ncbi:Hypothetical predicted protein, partial [Podarcis lilfordi]
HYPKQSFTTVADTPENLRLKQQSELQSQVKYKRDFEESKGRGFSIVTDTPELQRLKRTQEQISNVCGPLIVVQKRDAQVKWHGWIRWNVSRCEFVCMWGLEWFYAFVFVVLEFEALCCLCSTMVVCVSPLHTN